MSAEDRVHLDHHIERESIRYEPSNSAAFVSQDTDRRTRSAGSEDNAIRISDIEGEWFTRVRKPDFQRETNAWSPEQCVEFLDSVIYGRIIPSIILWRNEVTGSVFVLDGAHRLSVVRAWMKDDWGSEKDEYYKRKTLKT